MPKIIRNGKTYSGIPTEGVTTSTPASTPPSSIKTLRDTSGTVPFVPETTPSAVKYSNGNSLETTIGSIAKIEGTTASRNFSKGEYIVRNGQLYIVSVSVLSGETWTVGTNIDSTSVGAELSSLNSNKASLVELTNGSAEIGNYNLFYLVLRDGWVSGLPIIGCLYARNQFMNDIRHTFDYGGYQSQYSVSLNGNTFSATSLHTTSPNQDAPVIHRIYGIA